MSSTPNPARLADYQAKLAELTRERDAARAQRDIFRVRRLNRRIQAQLKWIERAQTTPR